MGETVPFDRKNGDAAPIEETRIYSNEEVSEIIGVALRNAQTGDGNTVNHEEMLSIASEFGLSGGDIQRALETLAEKQEQLEIAEKTELAFKLHIAAYLTICAGLFGINMLSSPSYLWFLYPAILWGAVVVLHGIVQRYAPNAEWLLLEPMLNRTGGGGLYSAPLEGPGRATFYIDEVMGPLATANGIVELTDDALVLEYEIEDSIFGAIKSKVHSEVIPYEDITGAHLHRGMWNSKLTLQGRRLSTFAEVPLSKGGEATLTFKREQRNAAEHLAQELNARCSR